MIKISFNNEELASVVTNMYYGLTWQNEVTEEDLILYSRMYDMLEDKSGVPKPSSLERFISKDACHDEEFL